jgi:hypothetical protein
MIRKIGMERINLFPYFFIPGLQSDFGFITSAKGSFSKIALWVVLNETLHLLRG